MRPTKSSDIHFVAIDRISYVCNFEIRFESLYAKTKITKCTRDAFSREHFVIFVFPYKDLNNRRFQKHTLEIHRLLQEYHGLCGVYNSRGMFSYSKSQHRFQSANMINSRIFSSMHLYRHIPQAVSHKVTENFLTKGHCPAGDSFLP